MSLSGRMPSITGPGGAGVSVTFSGGAFTIVGTAGQTYTLPTTTATIARTDAAQSFTGIQTILGTSALKFGATAQASIGVSADTTSANLVLKSTTTGLVQVQEVGSTDYALIVGGSAGATSNVLRLGRSGSSGKGYITLDQQASGFDLIFTAGATESFRALNDNGVSTAGGIQIPGVRKLYFGATAAATIGVSADTTSGNLQITAPSSGFNALIGGTMFGSWNEQTGATYTVAATDNYINCNRAGTITLTLGTATSGRVIHVRTITANTVVSASSNVVPNAGGAAGTAILAATAGKWATLIGDGTNWQIFQAN